MLISYGRAAADPTPQRIETSWPALVQWLYQHPRTPAKLSVAEYTHLKQFPSKSPEGLRIHVDKDGPYIALADFGGHRRAYESLLHSSGVPLDFDTGRVGAETIQATLAGITYVAFTTYAHTPESQRWRVFVPTSRPMSADEHSATWAYLNERFEGQADPAAKDATRLSYLPGVCLLPDAARILHADGTLLQPIPVAPAPPATLQTHEGPVPGWAGPTDDNELITIACHTRIKVAERFGGPVHFAMLWTANEEWLAVTFPPGASEEGQSYSRTRADAALASELAYWTGGDEERAANLMRRSGLARPGDDDWATRKVYLAFAKGMERRTAKQFHFMGAAPTDAELKEACNEATAVLVPTGTQVDMANAGIEIDLNAPPTYCLDKKMQFPATLENVVYILGKQCHWVLGYDEFRGRVMVAPVGTENWRPVSDNDQVAMRETFGRELHFAAVGKDLMRDAVNLIAERHKFDSAQVWLNSLEWDGVPRVATYLSQYCGVEDTPYTQAVSQYIWTGLAGRIMTPGCQLDMVVAFQSPQGRRKSTGLAAMVPDPECFTDGLSLHEGGDDFKRMLKGKLVIEIAELAGLSKADVNAVKMTITRRFEEWVEKWETQPRRYQRRGMLFASTNEQYFLPADDTGNRRWLPVPGVTLNREAIERDRLQLWAEGRTIYAQAGIAWQDAERLAPAEHGAHTAVDIWGESIETWLNTVPPLSVEQTVPLPPPSCRPFSMPELLRGALHMNNERQDMRAEKRAAGVLRVKGYEYKSVREKNSVRKLWIKL